MRHYPKRLLAATLALVLGSVALTAPLPHRPLSPEKAAQNAILKLAEILDTTEVAALAQRIVREHDSEDISSVFKLKRVGGLGVGSIAPTENQDGIERLIRTLARKQLKPEELEKYHADLLRTANVMRAMSELAPYRLPEAVAKLPNRAEQWQQVSADFKSTTAEFRSAVAEKDPIKVKNAATRLDHTCCNCHSLRD